MAEAKDDKVYDVRKDNKNNKNLDTTLNKSILNGAFDSHCHLEQSENPDELIEECKNAGMVGLVSSCARFKDVEITKQIANKYPDFIHFTLGLHPTEAIKINKDELDNYISVIREIKDPLFVGVGEVGLDFFLIKGEEEREKSKEVFIEFVHIADELNLPLVIHCRDAYPEMIDILSNEFKGTVVFHYFNKPEYLEDIANSKLNRWFISLPITISKLKISEIHKLNGEKILDSILLETDSPISIGKRMGKRVITPINIAELIEKISAVTGVEQEKIVKKTTENARKVFRINFENKFLE